MLTLGLYIHVPFCTAKCHYCDFFSLEQDEKKQAHYVRSLVRHLQLWGQKTKEKTVDTVYFGGGTPSQLTTEQLELILNTIDKSFSLAKDCEITLEANPEHLSQNYCNQLYNLGINRVSLGMQSAHDTTLTLIGRRHNAQDVKNAVKNLQQSGIHNISLDIMGALPQEDEKELQESLEFALNLNVPHLSFYLLKVEPGTYLFAHQDQYTFANEDQQASLFVFASNFLEQNDFTHYEISNFCKTGFESKHNLKYWQAKEYLGIGPSAHSLLSGQRFYYPNSLNKFNLCNNLNCIVLDQPFEPIDYFIFGLRLNTGVNFKKAKELFGLQFKTNFFTQARELEKNKLVLLSESSLKLTKEGFLVSNAIISHLLPFVLS